ncbi:hypothetical protein [Enterococcus sp. LJL51]|uniref:hypothetical protein n=1 Tax=Enterococcus sp. LJL51 TaxID=3416656 RepID=UPI003CF28E38
MEKWKEVFKNEIPNGNYQVSLNNGEQRGLHIELESFTHRIAIDFGVVSAIRMLDEGTLLNNTFYNESELSKYKVNNFSNVIYLIEDGQFGRFVKDKCKDMYDILNLKHYLIITLNYCIEVITRWEPEIEVELI